MNFPYQHISFAGVRAALLIALLVLTACAPAVREPALPPLAGKVPQDFPVQRYQPQALPAHGKILRIDSKLSDLRILVYRGGELARFGHNHVVSSADLQGYAFYADNVLASRFDLFLPLNRLIVDDPVLRTEEGDDFSSAVSDKDSQGTRANMLGEKVLDAAQFPFLQISGEVAASSPPAITLQLDINLHGVIRSLQTQANVSETANGLIVEGNFKVRQSDFGIEPFSALLGRLKVVDEVTIKYKIVASGAGAQKIDQ